MLHKKVMKSTTLVDKLNEMLKLKKNMKISVLEISFATLSSLTGATEQIHSLYLHCNFFSNLSSVAN